MSNFGEVILETLQGLACEMRNLDGELCRTALEVDPDLTIREWAWAQKGVDLAIERTVRLLDQ